MKTTTRIILIALISLLIGGIVGFFAAGRITKKRLKDRIEMKKPPRIKKKLEDRLALTEDQRNEFDDIFTEHMKRMQEIERGVHQKRHKELLTMFDKLNEILDAKQQKKLERFVTRFKERRNKRGHRPPPPPPHHME